MKIMASGPITSWQIDGETMKTVTDFIFLGSKITADGNCSHEIKRRLFLGRKAMTNVESILRGRYYFANKGLYSQCYGFSSSHEWMWELNREECWVPENWCFWTVVGEDSWESLGLQGDPTSQFWRKSVLNIHWKDWCWSWSFNTLATWCKELTLWKMERLKAGGEGDDRGWDGWMASPTWWTWVWVSSRSWWWTGRPDVLQSVGLQSQTWQRDWTELKISCILSYVVIYYYVLLVSFSF